MKGLEDGQAQATTLRDGTTEHLHQSPSTLHQSQTSTTPSKVQVVKGNDAKMVKLSVPHRKFASIVCAQLSPRISTSKDMSISQTLDVFGPTAVVESLGKLNLFLS